MLYNAQDSFFPTFHGKCLFGDELLGVFSADKFPENVKDKQYFIINTDAKRKQSSFFKIFKKVRANPDRIELNRARTFLRRGRDRGKLVQPWTNFLSEKLSVSESTNSTMGYESEAFKSRGKTSNLLQLLSFNRELPSYILQETT